MGLHDWAAIAEIAGTIAVVVSLLFVAQSLDRNTAALSSDSTDDVLDALREIETSVINNSELLQVILRGSNDPESLNLQELEQYKRYVAIYIDEWDMIDAWERLGLLRPENLEGWHPYFETWVEKHVTPELWEEIRWNWADSKFVERIDAILSN